MDTAVGSLIALVAIAAALWFGVRWLVRSFSKYHGSRIVTCPETERPTVVKVDSLHASLTSMVGPPDIRIKDCSRWPIKQQCGQECLTNLDVAPETCLVNGVLMHWYRGKNCVYCRKAFSELEWLDHRPALLSPDRELLNWGEVKLERLQSVLATHSPVCWNCYIAQTFRRDHPDLVVLRPWRNNSPGADASSASRHP